MKRNIVKKEFKKTDSKGREEIWEWDETPEVRAALANCMKQLVNWKHKHLIMELVND